MIPDYKLVEDAIDKLHSDDDFLKSCVPGHTRNSSFKATKTELQSEYTKKLKQATRESWDFLVNSKLTVSPPRVLKVCQSWSSNLVATVNRLHVVQNGTIRHGKTSFSVKGREFFNRWIPKYVNGILVKELSPKSFHSVFSNFSRMHLCEGILQDSYPDDSSVARVFNEQLSERFDHFDTEWRTAWDTSLRDAEKIINKFSGVNTDKEASKFREKLRKFLSETPGLLDINPDTMLECMSIDPDDLDDLVKFLRRNKSSLIFVCREDFESSQKEAQVQGVMES